MYNIQLDTFITVVDASLFHETFGSEIDLNMKSDLAFKPDDLSGRKTLRDGSGARLITELLLEQVECADVILINKCDLLNSTSDLELVEKVIFKMNPTARVLTCTKGEIPEPSSVLAIGKGVGATSWGILDEHRKMIEAVEKEIIKEKESSGLHATHHDHDHSHNSESDTVECTDSSHTHEHEHSHSTEQCQDVTCTDPTHDHSHVHDHATTECHDVTCNDPSHNHDHSHSSSCSDPLCTDPTHDHDHSHDHSSTKITTAEERFKITSFIYKRRKPFHPIRFSRFLQAIGKLSVKSIADISAQENRAVTLSSTGTAGYIEALTNAKKALLRSKGFVWMASSTSVVYFLSHAGQYIELLILGTAFN